MSAAEEPPSAVPQNPYPPAAPPFRDRGTATLCMGLFVAFLGLCCLGMTVLMALSLAIASAAPPSAGTPFRSIFPAVAVYLALAAFFLTCGIGAAMVKRWARALLAVISWLWLGMGTFGLVTIIVLLPKLRTVFANAAPAGSPAPPIGLMLGCMVAAVIVIYVGLPLPLALFFSGKNVRATFEARDRIRWTDRLPAPLLGLFVVFAFSFLSALALPFYGVIPAFGRLFSGPAASAIGMAFAAACGAGAWWVWRRSILGWWTGVALWICGTVSTLVTLLSDFDWNAYYTQAGLTEEQIRLTRGLSPAELFANPLVVGLMILCWIGLGALLIWTKKFFPDRLPIDETGSAPAPPR